MSVIEQFERALAGVNYQVIPLHQPRIQAYAQNANGHPALLVRVDDRFDREVDGTGGIAVRVDRVGTPNRCLRFESESLGLTPMFIAVVNSLLDEVGELRSEADGVHQLLDHYDELCLMFARRSGRLGESALRGLFAELVMLLELKDNGYTVASAINAWQGPYRVAKDFVLPLGRAVEVKSIRRANRRVRISSVDQLDPRGEDLRLAILVLDRVSAGEGRSVLDLLDEIELWTESDPASRLPYVQAISALGLDASDPYYQRWRFEIGAWRWFSVREDFPRIEPASVPPAISRVSFSLDTDQLEAFASGAFWEQVSSDV